MMDALWSDVSEFQVPVDDSYPYEVLAIRSDDGTYRDHNWTANYGWARRALAFGKLKILIVYLVYRPNWRDELAVIKDMMGTPPDQSVIMVDVESWNGQITGNHSANINALVAELTHWIGPRRVIGYGNTGDLNSLWPTKPQGMRLVVAGYGSNPDYPGKLAHQFTDGVYGGPIRVPPFGMADVNSADGYDVDSLAKALGIESDVFTITDIGDEEHDTVHNIAINDTGRVLLICPTGDAAANKRQAWLSAALLDLKGAAWIQVYVQSLTGGIADWRWTEVDLSAGPDNLVRRVWKEIPNNTSHLVVSWNVSGAPSGGALCLETKTNA